MSLPSVLKAPIQPAFYYEEGGVPVFKPTWDEFHDFNSFVSSIDSYGARAGIVKIIPPKEWLEEHSAIDRDKLSLIQANPAIEQQFYGNGGVFTQVNIPRKKKMGVLDWRDFCDSTGRKTPRFDPKGWSKKPERTPKSLKSVRTNSSKKAASLDKQLNDSSASRTPDDLLKLIKKEDFPSSAAYFNELERHYWKNITFVPPLYGADISGSLFTKETTHWNIANLDNLLNRVGSKVPGVNTPYLYFGSWKATFSWHLEDMDLYSINYIHFGAPKQWYVVPPEHKARFERAMQSIFPEAYKKCSEFIRHKTFLVSPSVLAHHSIPVHKCVQEANEIILTFPFGYHAGYNMGFNCAESINFALPRWVEIGKNAKSCTCVKDSVKIDVDSIFGKRRVAPLNVAKKRRKISCSMCGKSDEFDELLPVENDKVHKIHRICAKFIPELDFTSNDETMVSGISSIPKARRKLKCRFCDFRGGACVQCAKGMCVTAFHATCATQHDLFNQENSVEIDGEEVKVNQFFCFRHTPDQNISQEAELNNLNKIFSKFRKDLDDSLQNNEGEIDHVNFPLRVLVRFSDGDTEEGVLADDYPDKCLCKVIFSDSYFKIVSYLNVCLLK